MSVETYQECSGCGSYLIRNPDGELYCPECGVEK